MSLAVQNIASAPRFQRDRVVFDIQEGTSTVTCSVTKAAIQDASGGRPNLPDAVLAAFALLRDRIEVVARAKLRARPSDDSSVLHIWSSDLDDDSDEAAPPTAG